MHDTIVLGFPHNLAINWMLLAETKHKKTINSFHPLMPDFYLRFARNKQTKLINDATSLLLLFENVYVYPDCHNIIKHQINGNEFKLTEFGVEFEDALFIPYYLKSWPQDIKLERIFRRLKIENKHQYYILVEALRCLRISHLHHASIIGYKWFVEICLRVAELYKQCDIADAFPIDDFFFENYNIFNSTIRKLFKCHCISFQINNVDDFIALRQSKRVKKYGEKLKEFIHKSLKEIPDERYLLGTILEIIDSVNLSNKIKGVTSLSSTFMNIVSLLPIVGTATGLCNIATDLGSRIKDIKDDKIKWWFFAPEAVKILSKNKVERLYLDCVKGSEK